METKLRLNRNTIPIKKGRLELQKSFSQAFNIKTGLHTWSIYLELPFFTVDCKTLLQVIMQGILVEKLSNVCHALGSTSATVKYLKANL